MKRLTFLLAICCLAFSACESEDNPYVASDWHRDDANPVLRDPIPAENYQAASDPHVFYDADGVLRMVYTGDANGNASIKLATGTSPSAWQVEGPLLAEVGPSGRDIQKETAFYRRAADGKHQIYYIGYPDEATYQSEVYLAEADELTGPYVQQSAPVVSRGTLAGKNVYLITSPSVVEHEGLLYMSFLGWNDAPDAVTEVWVIGATSSDEGRTWSDYRLVDTRIGMEGQVTKVGPNVFVAVRTGEYGDREGIYYATAPHPFGPWAELPDPILVQQEPALEKDEIIAPQITVDPTTGQEYLFYTGADYQIGWWVMFASKD